MNTDLTEFVGRVKHFKCGSPANIAVKGNLQWFRKSTASLSALEIFDTLSGSLNLRVFIE